MSPSTEKHRFEHFAQEHYTAWAPEVAAFVRRESPKVYSKYSTEDVIYDEATAAHYGLFVDEKLVAVAGVCASNFSIDREQMLYTLSSGPYEGELAHDDRSRLLSYVERAVHDTGFSMLTVLTDKKDGATFYRTHGYKRRIVYNAILDEGFLYMCKYLYQDNVIRVQFARV